MSQIPQPGGFLAPSLPSPSPSTTSTPTSTIIPVLPHPRTHPLRSGSQKEDTTRRYIEARLLHISRRYTKKFQDLNDGDAGGGVTGYTNFADAGRDLSEVVDVLWRSGTPSLQIPYLLQIALSTSSYLPSFPPSPAASFSLLKKLDHAFASLITGRDKVSGEILPGLEGGGLSRTDMVRLRSLVLESRIVVVEVMDGLGDEDGEESLAETATGSESEGRWTAWDGGKDEDGVGMEIGRVYEATIEQLNLALGGDGFDATSV